MQAGGKDRTALDTAVLAALALPTTFLTTLQAALDSMQGLSSAVQEPVSVDAATDSGWPEGATPAVTLEPNEEVTLDLDEVRVLLHQVGLDRRLLTEQSAICVLALADGAERDGLLAGQVTPA